LSRSPKGKTKPQQIGKGNQQPGKAKRNKKRFLLVHILFLLLRLVKMPGETFDKLNSSLAKENQIGNESEEDVLWRGWVCQLSTGTRMKILCFGNMLPVDKS
jgi:hypothetical protein